MAFTPHPTGEVGVTAPILQMKKRGHGEVKVVETSQRLSQDLDLVGLMPKSTTKALCLSSARLLRAKAACPVPPCSYCL